MQTRDEGVVPGRHQHAVEEILPDEGPGTLSTDDFAARLEVDPERDDVKG